MPGSIRSHETRSPGSGEAIRTIAGRAGWAPAADSGQSHAASPDEAPPARLSASQLARVRDTVDARIDGQLSLGALADTCSLSVGHFVRAFRGTVGATPHQWLMQRRVERACNLLRDPALAIAEVAILTGFADQSHLTRVFAARVGQTPARWRRENRRIG